MARPRLISTTDHSGRLVGQAPAIVALRAHIRQLVIFDALDNPVVPTVLMQGETGTGKGLVARVIHESGPRAEGAFIEVNCAAIPESLLEAELFGFEAGAFTDAKRAKPGLWEAASGGILFLDEIDALPLTLQSKLLTVIEAKRVRRLGAVVERPVDVKLITATQVDLQACVSEGRFQADLYYRLAVVLLEVPPLRERGGGPPKPCRCWSRRSSRLWRWVSCLIMRFVWSGWARRICSLVGWMKRVPRRSAPLSSPGPTGNGATKPMPCASSAKSRGSMILQRSS
jgi:DNA-binding NtrC family response regulator